MQKTLQALERVEQLANTSKLGRFVAQPIKYGQAILFRQFIYPYTRRPLYKKCRTFFGTSLTVGPTNLAASKVK